MEVSLPDFRHATISSFRVTFILRNRRGSGADRSGKQRFWEEKN
jgi:hypothetical protein